MALDTPDNLFIAHQGHRISKVPMPSRLRHGYMIIQVKRNRAQGIFGWSKTIVLLAKLHHRGRDRVGWMFTLAAAAYNLVRMRNLIAATNG